MTLWNGSQMGTLCAGASLLLQERREARVVASLPPWAKREPQSFVPGRTTRSSRSEYNRAETIEETAALVTELGGTGIAAAVDHLDPEQVKHLAGQIRKSTAASTCLSTTSGEAN